MNAGRTVFSQLIEFLPHQEFQKCVARYGGDRYLKNLSCWDQYLAMAFAQLTYRESLRDIEACLRSVSGKLYHMGFRGKVARSTLADANEARNWRIYADFAQVLIAIARPLHARDPKRSRSPAVWPGRNPEGSLEYIEGGYEAVTALGDRFYVFQASVPLSQRKWTGPS